MATVFGSLVRAALLAAAVGQRTARVPPYAEGIEQVLAAYAAATGGYGFAVVVDHPRGVVRRGAPSLHNQRLCAAKTEDCEY